MLVAVKLALFSRDFFLKEERKNFSIYTYSLTVLLPEVQSVT
jgi:hypothetical protein